LLRKRVSLLRSKILPLAPKVTPVPEAQKAYPYLHQKRRIALPGLCVPIEQVGGHSWVFGSNGREERITRPARQRHRD
jgi:hypothetical protein